MNTTTVSNVVLFTLAVGALTSSIEIIKTRDYITGAALFVIGIILVFVYEKLPPSTSK